MDTATVLKSVTVLMEAEPEVAEGFLMAAIYVRAIRTDSDPRTILDALWKAMPDSEVWPQFREALVTMLDGENDPPH